MDNKDEELSLNVKNDIIVEEKNTKKTDNTKFETNALIKLANLFFVLSVICFAINMLIVFSVIIVILIVLLATVALILTLFLLYNHFVKWIEKAGQIGSFIKQGFVLFPYLASIGLAMVVISLLIYIFSKNYIHRKSKIITTSIFVTLETIFLVLIILFKNAGVI